MKYETARLLSRITNDKGLLDALEAYVEERIALAHKNLETVTEPRMLGIQQGAIAELRRILTIRDEVNATVKEKK